jgi:hypothetical protein
MGRARLERPDNLLRLPGQHAALDVVEVKRLGSRPRRVRQRPRRDALPLVPQRGRPRVDDGRRRARDAADDDRARRASIRREVRVRAEEGETQRLRRRRLRVVVHTSDDIGVELKGVRSGVEMRRGVSGLKARDPGRRESPGEKVLKDRRSPRRRGRTGTSVKENAPPPRASAPRCARAPPRPRGTFVSSPTSPRYRSRSVPRGRRA